ncbi:unnamed protein product [Arabis nemorensis]|uniref:MADS-box domain-containing protein n=1 Tax=Arabis nemorensis TaxID=586526 RepID=A0A565CNL5_9BRAS|nr:unnamed protein product [Arabis nemorensis]
MDSKLCPRHTTRFKRSSHRDSKTTSTSLALREDTMFKKAYELSTLCDIEVCVLYYGRDGELIKTCPEDKAKVRDMAERFSQLSHIEKRKKSSNLSEFLSKKMSKDKKDDFNKFTQKLLEMEHSLERRLPILQDRLGLLFLILVVFLLNH